MKLFPFVLAILVALPLFAQNKAINASESSVSFKIKNAGMTVDGSFSGITGSITFDKNNLSSSKFDAQIRTSTINTEVNMRDKHLKAEDYFDVGKYPTMNFVSSSISKQGSSYKVTGKLTIKDVTKEISFPFTVSESTGKVELKGSFDINRRDYNVGDKSWMMSDDVTVDLVVAAK